MLIQFLINGLVNGSLIALMALGFALIYNTTNVFHISFATWYMMAPYFVYTGVFTFGMSFFASSFFAIVLCAGVAVLTQITVHRNLEKRKASHSIHMISSIGIMTIIINVIALAYGNETKILDNEISKSLRLGEIIVTYKQLYQLIIASVCLSAFGIVLSKSNIGLKIKALSSNPELSSVFQLNKNKMLLVLFAFSGILAAISGILTAWDVGMDPYVGMPVFLNAVVAMIIGGVGKYKPAILGGFALGILHALVIWQLSAHWAEAVTFILLIIFLLFRPQGIWGEKLRTV